MELNNEQLKIVKSMLFKEANDGDLQYVRQVCKSRGLDPFAGHVVFAKRGPNIVVTTTIDGARTKAARTGEYAGSDKPIFTGEGADMTCEVTTHRLIKNNRCPFTSELLMKEFRPPAGKDHQWKRMPRHMLAKCTEMASLRKAFPESCGGEYEVDEHIAEETIEHEKAPAQVLDTPSNDARWSKVKAAFAVYGIDEKELLADAGVADKVENLNEEHFEFLHKWYTERKNAPAT